MIRANPMGAATAIIALVALVAAALSASGSISKGPTTKPSSKASGSHLERCRALGEAGGGDPLCQAVWTDQRRRFFGQTSTHEGHGVQSEPGAGR